MENLRRLLMKKKEEGKMLSPIEKDAKMSVLQNLHKDMSDSMAGKLNGLKKVTVAADNEHDLSHGLDKAKEILGKAPEHESDMSDEDMMHEGSPEEEMEESPEEELAEEHDPSMEAHEDDAHMSEEEIDAKLKELMALKAARNKA